MEIRYGGLAKRITVSIRPVEIPRAELIELIVDGVRHLLTNLTGKEHQEFREFLGRCLEQSK